MPLYRVTLERPVGRENANPFLRQLSHMSMTETVTMLCRTFEFEAKSEGAVRWWLRKAQRDELAGVRGFALRSIEVISPSARCTGC